ncbi:MAG: site-2 protease family protein [Fuerstiella sp.]
MIGQAGETEFDLRFRFFGIPVRVHPFFWLMAAFVVWRSTPDPRLKFLGVICVFVSILVHEMGHALTLRRYGYPSEIVLYAMGGYATSTHLSTWRNVLMSAAGPAAGFLLYGLIRLLISFLIGYSPDVLQNDATMYCLSLLLWINLWWGVLNLVPCLPLDGGRIMEALVLRYVRRRSRERVLQISILASGAVAVWALQHLPSTQFMLFLFGFLCANSVIAYNQQQGRM